MGASLRAAVGVGDAVARVRAHAAAAHEVRRARRLGHVAGAGRLQHLMHESQRMLVEALVVVGPGVGDPRKRDAEFVGLICEVDAVLLARVAFANDLQARHVIVECHALAQFHAEHAGVGHQRPRMVDRQGPLAHKGVTAVEILALVLVIPVLAHGHRGRALVPADLVLHHAPDRVVGVDHKILANEAVRIGEAVGVFRASPRRRSQSGRPWLSRVSQRRRRSPGGSTY